MLGQMLTIRTGCLKPGIESEPLLLLQITKSQKDTGENHAISALKFEIIKEFLLLGWNVLLSDIDVVVVQVCLRYVRHGRVPASLAKMATVGACCLTMLLLQAGSNRALLLSSSEIKLWLRRTPSITCTGTTTWRA